MKLKLQEGIDVNVDVDFNAQDLEDLTNSIGDNVVMVIGFYMAADVARHILKALIR